MNTNYIHPSNDLISILAGHWGVKGIPIGGVLGGKSPATNPKGDESSDEHEYTEQNDHIVKVK